MPLEARGGSHASTRAHTYKHTYVRTNSNVSKEHYPPFDAYTEKSGQRYAKHAARDVTVVSIRRRVAERRHASFVSFPARERDAEYAPARRTRDRPRKRQILHLFLCDPPFYLGNERSVPDHFGFDDFPRPGRSRHAARDRSFYDKNENAENVA